MSQWFCINWQKIAGSKTQLFHAYYSYYCHAICRCVLAFQHIGRHPLKKLVLSCNYIQQVFFATFKSKLTDKFLNFIQYTDSPKEKKIRIRKVTRMWDKIVLLFHRIKHPILNLRILNLFMKMSLFNIRIFIFFIFYFETLCTGVNQNMIKFVSLVHQIKHPILNIRILNLFTKISLFVFKVGTF